MNTLTLKKVFDIPDILILKESIQKYLDKNTYAFSEIRKLGERELRNYKERKFLPHGELGILLFQGLLQHSSEPLLQFFKQEIHKEYREKLQTQFEEEEMQNQVDGFLHGIEERTSIAQYGIHLQSLSLNIPPIFTGNSLEVQIELKTEGQITSQLTGESISLESVQNYDFVNKKFLKIFSTIRDEIRAFLQEFFRRSENSIRDIVTEKQERWKKEIQSMNLS